MTTTREAALEAALKRSTEGWANALELGLIPERHRNTALILRDAGFAALSTPATAPNGYVDVAKDRADWLLDAVACATQNRQFLRGEPEYDQVAGEAILLNGEKAISVAISRALAARHAPQPAADTRGGCAAALAYASSLAETLHDKHYSRSVSWKPMPDLLGLLTQIDNMVAGIIGTASPAPSDKIAEAAQDKTAAELVIDAYDAANPFRQADMHPALCHCNRCAIDWLRALAGKGE